MLRENISQLGIILCLLLKTQPILMDGRKGGLNLLLVGKTGNGKSATGNSIMGQRLFETSPGVNSLTKDIKRVESIHDGRKLTVVDSPGFIDNHLSPTEYLPVFFDYMDKAMRASPHGYHAFLFVVRYGVRLTPEDEQTFQALTNCFGEEYFTRYGILVVTFADTYDPEENNGKLFLDWIHTQGGFLKEIKNRFGGRVVSFDNKCKDTALRRLQFDHLIKIVDQLSVQNSRYTDGHFELARFQRKRYLVKAKLLRIKLEVEKDLEPVIKILTKINSDEPGKQMNQLLDLYYITVKLLKKIQEEDEGTDVLIGTITAIENVVDKIKQLINCFRNPSQGNDQQEYGSVGLISNAIEAAKYVLSYVYDIASQLLFRYERQKHVSKHVLLEN